LLLTQRDAQLETNYTSNKNHSVVVAFVFNVSVRKLTVAVTAYKIMQLITVGKKNYKSDTRAARVNKCLLRKNITISNVERHFPYNIEVINIGQMTVILNNNPHRRHCSFLQIPLRSVITSCIAAQTYIIGTGFMHGQLTMISL
jgi:hypothetical protein